jgi:hypothetical protein
MSRKGAKTQRKILAPLRLCVNFSLVLAFFSVRCFREDHGEDNGIFGV